MGVCVCVWGCGGVWVGVCVGRRGVRPAGSSVVRGVTSRPREGPGGNPAPREAREERPSRGARGGARGGSRSLRRPMFRRLGWRWGRERDGGIFVCLRSG